MNDLVKPKRESSSVVISKKRRRAFLNALARTGRVIESARAAGYESTSFLHRLRAQDAEFAAEWDEALEAAADVLEDEATRRAVEGVEKEVRYKGMVVGYERQYSDQLLMFLLKGANPDKFGDKKKVEHDHKGKVGIAVMPMTSSSMDDWELEALRITEEQKARKVEFERDTRIEDAEFEEAPTRELRNG